jgi:hypothetical protein
MQRVMTGLSSEGAQDRRVKGRNYQRIADLQVSTTDPDATLMLTKNGVDLGYHTHYVVDGGTSRFILMALVMPSEVMDNQPMLDLLWRTRFRWKLWPRQVTGDKKYGTEENLVAIEDQGIRAYIPIPDMDHRTQFLSAEAFTYEAERDVYMCPAGKELRFDRPHSTERQLRYRARARDCNHCALKAQCTTSTQGRSLFRSVDEACLKRVRAYQPTSAYKKALRKRQVWVEPLFAEGKDWHGMRRFRLRLLWRVNCEALMIASGQNLKRLLNKRGWGRRPCPAEAIFYPLFDLVLVVGSFFVVVCLYFHEYLFTFISEQAHIHSIFLMCFARGFFNSLSGLATRFPVTNLFFRPLFAFFIIDLRVTEGGPRRRDTVSY